MEDSFIDTFSYCVHFRAILQNVPANTKRNKHVIITSKRCFDVIITCSLRCVFAGVFLNFCILLAESASKVTFSTLCIVFFGHGHGRPGFYYGIALFSGQIVHIFGSYLYLSCLSPFPPMFVFGFFLCLIVYVLNDFALISFWITALRKLFFIMYIRSFTWGSSAFFSIIFL